MSYIALATGVPSFSKAVISLWFRVPQSSIDAALAGYLGDGTLLDGIIPLVVMGKKGLGRTPTTDTVTSVVTGISQGYEAINLGSTETFLVPSPTNFANDGDTRCRAHGDYSAFCTHVISYNPNASFVLGSPAYRYADQKTTSAAGPPPATNPTCIGVDCSQTPPALYVNFETGEQPAVSNLQYNVSWTPGASETVPGTSAPFVQGTDTQTGCSIQFGPFVPAYDVVETDTAHNVYPPDGTDTGARVGAYSDISALVLSDTGSIYSDQIPIAADEWHHVLVAVDLKTIETHGCLLTDPPGAPVYTFVDSTSRLFVALDDVNYTGFNLSGGYVDGLGDPNAVITDGAFSVAGLIADTVDDNGVIVGGLPRYKLTSPIVPSDGVPIGLPATADVVSDVHHVEMAEFQIFTGVTIDTADEANRRAFIAGDNFLQPTPHQQAALVIGKKPDVLLHGSSNWIAGKNSGTAGQFHPTGKIKSYKPDPGLPPGPQGSPQ